MCSSLKQSIGKTICSTEGAEKIHIASIPLIDILERIHPTIKIEFVKIDAQGMDFSVLKSAGNEKEVILFMEQNGFVLRGDAQQSHGMEKNLIFLKK